MKLIYNVKDKPRFGQVILFGLQQLLAIMAATIAVPAVINNACGTNMSASAALLGAGMGSIVYLLFTKSSSPVFLGSSFAFIGSMIAAFAGATSMAAGYWGLVIGAFMAGLVYVVIATVIKFCGVKWVNKLMPPVIIGPTVAIIGLSLSSSAIGNLTTSSVEGGSTYTALICGLFTLAVTMLCANYGRKLGRLIPFILGILAGYILSSILAVIGTAFNIPSLVVIDYSAFRESFATVNFSSFISVPEFMFTLGGTEGLKAVNGGYLLTLFAAYVPVAFVVFAEHLSDHKNLSFIIEKDLLVDPGLSRTLLGDGVGSMVGALFGGCPNTTYGESIGCVAITRNASTVSIWSCALMCIVFSFITPLMDFLKSIPSCVMGGVCVALYGFIAVSGFKMFQTVDLNRNRNLFVASVIFITGVGGMTVSFGKVTISTVACALILGILSNVMLSKKSWEDDPENN